MARRRLAPALIAGIVTAALALGVLGLFPTVVGAFVLLAVAGLEPLGLRRHRAHPAAARRAAAGARPGVRAARVADGRRPRLRRDLRARCSSGSAAPAPRSSAPPLLLLVIVAVVWRRLRSIDDAADVPQVQIQLLRLIPIFAPLPAPELEGLARALVPVHVAAGTTVIREGEAGDRFYAIADRRAAGDQERPRREALRRGDGFGEIALIEDVPRTATVTALTDAELFSLEKEPFVLALTGHAPAARAAGDMVSQRLGELEAL